MNDQSHYSFMFSYLEKEGINIDFKEFAFQLNTHPDFPSLYAFSDTLKFFKIDNIAASIENKNIDYLPGMFVALLQEDNQAPFLSFIEKSNDRYICSNENYRKSVDEKEFLHIWKNIVLVVEKAEDKLIYNPKRKIAIKQFTLMLLFFVVFAITLGFKMSSLYNIYIILGLAGVYLSTETLRQFFGGNSSFAKAVCNSNSSAISNCKTVITSKKTFNLFSLELSDLSIIFFVGQLLSFFLMEIGGMIDYYSFYLLVSLTLTLPVVIYSIYYQNFIEKKWCAICLMIISVLILEAVTLAAVLNIPNHSIFNWIPFMLFFSGFIISIVIWTNLKPFIKDFIALKALNIELFRFKRNYPLFKMALQSSKNYEYYTLESAIIVGNPNAGLKLSLVTNPFCGYCSKTHELIETLVFKYPKDILVNFRFNLDDSADELSKALHYTLIDIYFKEGQFAFMDVIGNWFKNKNLDAFFEKYGKKNYADNKISGFLSKMYQQNKDNELMFTPAIIINNNLFPEMYNREDLVYFINELIEDEELIVNDYKQLQKIK